MKKILVFSAGFILLLSWSCFAQTAIKAEIDKASIGIGETITYKLVITSALKNIPPPEIPNFEGFAVLSQARSSSLSFAQGSAKTVLVYAYVLSPKEKGKFSIGPSKLKIKESLIYSESFEIEVDEGKSSPNPAAVQPYSEKPQVTL